MGKLTRGRSSSEQSFSHSEKSNLFGFTDGLSWSPDGQYIIFDNFNYGTIGLWIPDVENGETFLLIGCASYSPEWFPFDVNAIKPEDFKPLADFTDGWTMLGVGGMALVIGDPGGASNNVRSEPQKGDNIIGKIPPGTQTTTLEGPVWMDGLIFWRVQSTAIPGGRGWTAEGDGSTYYLEPGKTHDNICLPYLSDWSQHKNFYEIGKQADCFFFYMENPYEIRFIIRVYCRQMKPSCKINNPGKRYAPEKYPRPTLRQI